MNISQQQLIQMLHSGIMGRRQLDKSDICLIVLYSAISLLSLSGNGLFLFLSFRYRGLRRHISYIMMSLAGSNLLVTCACVPLSALRLFYYTWHLGEVGCKLLVFFEGLALSVNSFSLASIAIIRARQSALMIPPNQASNRGLRLVVCVTWLSAVVVSIPVLFAFSLNEVHVREQNATGHVAEPNASGRPVIRVCGENDNNLVGKKLYSAYFLLLLFLSPCVVLTFSYGFTARFISRQFSRLTKDNGQQGRSVEDIELPMTNQTSVTVRTQAAAGRDSPGNRTTRPSVGHTRKLQRRTLRTVVVLVSFFFVCWFPKDLIIILQDFVFPTRADINSLLMHIYPYTQTLIYFHSAACPFLYWCLSRVFQHYVRKACHRPCS